MNLKNILVIAFLFVLGATSCDKSEDKYGDLLTAHPWYVGGIDYSYEFYTQSVDPDLYEYVNSMLEDENIFFFPGDMLLFSGSRISAECPDGSTYSYKFDYDRGIRIDLKGMGCYFDVKSNGDQVALRFTRSSLMFCLMCERDNSAAQYKEYWENLITIAQNQLKDFYVTYYLQVEKPVFADGVEGAYEGPVFDGTGQLIFKRTTLNLFWTNKRFNLSIDDKIRLDNGAEFYIQMPDIMIDYGFTPGSFKIEGEYTVKDFKYGNITTSVSGQYNADGTLTLDFYITNNDQEYKLQFLKGTHVMGYSAARSEGEAILLKAVN